MLRGHASGDHRAGESATSSNAHQSSALRLLLRASRKADEWWPSFIMRSIVANGVNVISPAELAVAQQLEEAHTDGRTVEDHTADYGSPRRGARYGAHVVPFQTVRDLNYLEVSICPACVEQECYIRMGWTLSGYEVCAVHGLRMQIRCPSCRCRWTLLSIFKGRCRCGHCPRNFDAGSRVDGDSTAVSRAVWGNVIAHADHAASASGSAAICHAHVTTALLATLVSEDELLHGPFVGGCLTEKASKWIVGRHAAIEALEHPETLLNSLDDERHFRLCFGTLEALLRREEQAGRRFFSSDPQIGRLLDTAGCALKGFELPFQLLSPSSDSFATLARGHRPTRKRRWMVEGKAHALLQELLTKAAPLPANRAGLVGIGIHTPLQGVSWPVLKDVACKARRGTLDFYSNRADLHDDRIYVPVAAVLAARNRHAPSNNQIELFRSAENVAR